MSTTEINQRPADPNPKCKCWSRDDGWYPASEWDHLVFFDTPSSYRHGLKMRVCERDTRTAHILAGDDSLGMDVELLSEDPGGQLMWVQKGFCWSCCRYEWRRLCRDRPTTPVTWIKCTRKTNNKKQHK